MEKKEKSIKGQLGKTDKTDWSGKTEMTGERSKSKDN